MTQAKAAADLDFKTWGEPFHIFRKAMSTFYVVNDVLSWSEVCERQRTSVDSRKPDYLLQAMSDVDASAAQGFGIKENGDGIEGHMKGDPLLPVDCPSCERRNHCLRETCSVCGHELPSSELPKGEILEDEEPEEAASKAAMQRIAEIVEQNPEVIEQLEDEV